MLEKGTKIKLVKEIGMLKNVGEIFEVIDTGKNTIVFPFREGCMCTINKAVFTEHFEIVESEEKPAPTVDPDWIEYLMTNSKVIVNKAFDKCTIVSMKLPSGFVITESLECISPEDYDEEIGVSGCLDRIERKLWELEAYRLQWEHYENSDLEEYECDNPDCCGCCFTDRECEDCENNIGAE